MHEIITLTLFLHFSNIPLLTGDTSREPYRSSGITTDRAAGEAKIGRGAAITS